MNTNAAKTIAVGLFAATAWAQAQAEAERTLRLNHASTAQEVQELVVICRSMTDLPDIQVAPSGSLVLRGPESRLAFAEWLVHEIDKPEGFAAAPREFKVSGGDDNARIFNLSGSATPRQLQEVATIVRGTAAIPRVFTYGKARAIAVRGTSEQMEAAEWLVKELERPPATSRETREYRAASAGDGIRIDHVPAAATPQSLQELATLIRSSADIRQVFTYNHQRSIIVRGSAPQLDMAGWLATAVPSQAGTPGEFRAGPDDLVRVYHPTHLTGPTDHQELATAIRAVADIRRLFTYSSPSAIALRGTAEQIKLADWLMSEFDKPSGQPRADSGVYTYAGPEGTVRVFYLTLAETPTRLQEVATQVRSITGVRRIFTCNAPRAMTLRGTPEQIAHAERLIKERAR